MLVLLRRFGEKILINKGQIEIKILYSHKGQIAIGIKAPSNIEIDREEIYLRKQAENTQEGESHALSC